MAKLMLVEDDNNLREIYEARLQAEGYTIVSARDGEEALVIAKAEKPDLIISDVMMPKISGFEMLDILRNTDDMKGVKVIMLTALGQADDQQRADRLGADRYLVKSQVTLEDIVKVAHELLEDQTTTPSEPTPPIASTTAPAESPITPDEPPEAPPVVEAPPSPPAATIPMAAEPPVSAVSDEPAATDVTPEAQPAAKEAGAVEAQIEDFVAGASPQSTAQDAVTPVSSDSPTDQATTPLPDESESETEVIKPDAPVETEPKEKSDDMSSVPIANKKVISPIANDQKKDINTLLALEEAKQAIVAGPPPPTAVIATDAAGATSVPLADPKSEASPAAPSPEATTIIPTVEPPAESPTITPLNGDKIDPSSIAL